MYPFVESICVINGNIRNLAYHEKRMNATRQTLFGCADPIHLSDLLDSVTAGKEGTLKCRVEYRKEVERIELLPYNPPSVSNLKIVCDDTIEYSHKSTDRQAIMTLKEQAGNFDDILIVREGMVTDTSCCNVAFFDGHYWFTPARPLLKGTKRAQLLDRQMLIEKEIPASMIHEFQLVMLFNAMNEFGSILLPTHDIY